MATPKLQLLSKTLYDTDGTTTVWDFNFSGGYILTDHIKAYTETPAGLRTPITVTPAMLIGAWQLQITPALAAGNVLTIYRSTPKDQPMVDFVDRGQVSEVALDTVARQAIFVAAEASDDVATSNIDVAVAAANSAEAAKVAAQASASSAAGSASAAATSAGDAAASAASLSNLQGSTTVGRAVLKAADAAAARTAIGLGSGDAPTFAGLNGGQLAGLRNKIVNGKMDVAQRGASFAAAASGAYTLDRWVPSYSTGAVVTISQQADAPASNEFLNSLRIAVTTADTSIAASDNFSLFQNIEGYNVRDLIGKTFSLSFWARSSKTGVHCASLRNTGNDRSCVVEYTINAANTWEYKTITVTGGLPTAGTWNWTTGLGLSLGFSLACGSTFQTAAGAWQTGNFFATANQVNCLDTVGNIFAITGVQLEVGTVATPFEHRLHGPELALTRRYARPLGNAILGQAFGASTAGFSLSLDVPMRTIPTLSTTSGFTVSTAGGGNVAATPAIGSLQDNRVYITVSGASSLVAGNATLMDCPVGTMLSCEL